MDARCNLVFIPKNYKILEQSSILSDLFSQIQTVQYKFLHVVYKIFLKKNDM